MVTLHLGQRTYWAWVGYAIFNLHSRHLNCSGERVFIIWEHAGQRTYSENGGYDKVDSHWGQSLCCVCGFFVGECCCAKSRGLYRGDSFVYVYQVER